METENGVTYFQKLGFQTEYFDRNMLENEIYRVVMTEEMAEKVFLEACKDMTEIDVGEYIKQYGVYCYTSKELLSTFIYITGSIFIIICPSEARYLHDVRYTEDFYRYRATERLTNNEKHFKPSK